VAKTNDQAKLRLRGKGSGFVERDIKAESQEPLQLCISCPSKEGYDIAVQSTEELLKGIYESYSQHCMAKGMPDPAMEVNMTERHAVAAKGARKSSPDVFSNDDNEVQTPKKRRGGGRGRRPKAASQAPALPVPAAAPVAAPAAVAPAAVLASAIDSAKRVMAESMPADTIVPAPAFAAAMPGAPLVTPPTLVAPMPTATPLPLAAANGVVHVPHVLGTAASALKAKATPPSLTPPLACPPLHDLPKAPPELPPIPLPPLNNPCGCVAAGPRPLPTPEEINALVASRNAARRSGHFSEADHIREALRARGVVLSDERGGHGSALEAISTEVTTWRYWQD